MERWRILCAAVAAVTAGCAGKVESQASSGIAVDADSKDIAEAMDSSSDAAETAGDATIVPYDGDPSRCLGRGNFVYAYRLEKTEPFREAEFTRTEFWSVLQVPNDLWFSNDFDKPRLDLRFDSKGLGEPLHVGKYEDARYPPAPPGTAMLQVGFSGVACGDESSGSFEIHQLEWTTAKEPKVANLLATFKLSCRFYDYHGCVYFGR